MKRKLRRVRVVLVATAVATLVLSPGLPSLASGPAPESDPALERTRAQAKMLDDLFQVAVVDITRLPTLFWKDSGCDYRRSVSILN